MKVPELSVVIPFYNEEKTIEPLTNTLIDGMNLSSISNNITTKNI